LVGKLRLVRCRFVTADGKILECSPQSAGSLTGAEKEREPDDQGEEPDEPHRRKLTCSATQHHFAAI